MARMTYYAPTEGGETMFTVSATSMKFGAGCLAELGGDARELGMSRVALFTDKHVRDIPSARTALESLERACLDVAVYDEIHVEPTDQSFEAAADFAGDGDFDGYVSLGGGSVIDTAKAANLYATYPDELLAYVNAPIGQAKPVPGPLRPHIACPTTSGTGSETTSVCVFDLMAEQVKTGISSKFLRPTLALIDPDTTRTLPAGVVASTGFDVLTHAIESYTARPYTSRQRPEDPSLRPPYQGANPYSDIGSLEAIRMGSRYLARAVKDADDSEAREHLIFSATLAGTAFGNAGVHIPHTMSYSVAGLNHTFTASGYERDDPMVPHGISVLVNAPAAFRFTAEAAPERHLKAAEALGADVTGARPNDAGEALASRFIAMMRESGIPNGIGAIGYTEADIPALVKGAVAQKRLLAQSPLSITEDDLAALYKDAMSYW